MYKREEKCIHQQRFCTDQHLPFTNVIYRTGYDYILERITLFLFGGVSYFHRTVSLIFSCQLFFNYFAITNP